MRQTASSNKYSTLNNAAGIHANAMLVEDPNLAIKTIIKMTQSLIIMAEKESQALAKNDMLSLAILQDEKETITQRYVKISQEFRTRIEEFRGVDRNELDKLEKLQVELSNISKDNNAVLDRIQKRSQKKTATNMFTVQELAQNHTVFNENGDEFKSTSKKQKIQTEQ